MNRINDNLSAIDILSLFSVCLQILGYQNDMSQSSNDDLMRELQEQDREYLGKIIEQNNLILQTLANLADSKG